MHGDYLFMKGLINMRKHLFNLLACLLCAEMTGIAAISGAGPKNIKVLFFLPALNYGPNSYLTKDDMVKYGFEVTFAGVTRTLSGCSLFSALPAITVDTLLSEISRITDFDIVAIGPASWRAGDAYRDILNSSHVLQLIKSAADSGLVVWTLCGGVRVLAAADVIRGKNVLGAAVYKSEYENAGATYVGDDHPPVIDGNIVTCVRDQYYHVQNCEAMVKAYFKTSKIQPSDGVKK
jgi:putative intracellular protease/amidase